MTLSEFWDKFYSRPTISESSTLYVFDDEDSADHWIEDRYFNGCYHDDTLLFTIHSNLRMRYFMETKWCNAEVLYFYAVEPDVIAVVIKSDGEGDFDETCD